MLLEVLTQRAELGASLVRPGEGLLPSAGNQSNLGQAFSFAKSTDGKGLRGVGGHRGPNAGGETAALARARVALGVARAAANFNDLNMVTDYTRRFEVSFLAEVNICCPPGRVHYGASLRVH